jgi:hypothetical protein
MHQIDTFSENIISVDAAAKHVSRITGKKRNRSVILRWINRGVSGVRLSAIRVGGELHTSEQALNAFLNESQQAKSRKHGQATSTGIRAKQIEQQARSLGI